MTAVPEQQAPDLPVGTPVLLMPTDKFPQPMAGYVRQWADETPDAIRRTRVPVWLYGDPRPYAAWPQTVVAL
jgi:hypothetical protein